LTGKKTNWKVLCHRCGELAYTYAKAVRLMTSERRER